MSLEVMIYIPPQHSRPRTEYSIGVILTLGELSEPDIQRLQSFIFSHFTLIDHHLEKLKDSVEEALYNKKLYISKIVNRESLTTALFQVNASDGVCN